jgi:hypothetical protein
VGCIFFVCSISRRPVGAAQMSPNVITRIKTKFEKRIFRELLEILRLSPIKYDIMDLKIILKINIAGTCTNEY